MSAIYIISAICFACGALGYLICVGGAALDRLEEDFFPPEDV